MKPTTPNKYTTKPFCLRTFIKRGKGSKNDSGSQGCTVKKKTKKKQKRKQQPVNLNKKRLKSRTFKPMETLAQAFGSH